MANGNSTCVMRMIVVCDNETHMFTVMNIQHWRIMCHRENENWRGYLCNQNENELSQSDTELHRCECSEFQLPIDFK